MSKKTNKNNKNNKNYPMSTKNKLKNSNYKIYTYCNRHNII